MTGASSTGSAVVAWVSAMPITILVAVFLFVLKELVEAVRRYQGEARKKAALRTLIARECELNNWTISSIKHILKTIADESAADERTTFSFLITPGGKTLFRVQQPDEEFRSGSSLGSTHREVMNKNMLDIAMLDSELFAVLEPAYDAIALLEHVRESLIYYVQPEDEQDADHLEGLVDYYGPTELEKIYGCINNLYVVCTGKKLESVRLR